jgi:chromate transporter
VLFGTLSLLAFGGGNGVIPDMRAAAVDSHRWMTGPEFLDLFAMSRAAPGPGSLIVVLIGQKAAGLPGAAVASAAMYAPSFLLVHLAARAWHRAGQAPWREWAERALAPVAVGLTYASGLALLRGSEHAFTGYVVIGASTLLLSLTEAPPLLVLTAGALVSLAAG